MELRLLHPAWSRHVIMHDDKKDNKKLKLMTMVQLMMMATMAVLVMIRPMVVVLSRVCD